MNLSIARDGAEIGTWPREEVEALYQSGTLRSNDYFWCEGMLDWQPLLALVKPDPPGAKRAKPTLSSELALEPISDLAPASEPEEESSPKPEPQLEPPPRYVLPEGIKLSDDDFGKTEGNDVRRDEHFENASAKKPSLLVPDGRIGRVRFFAFSLIYSLTFSSVILIVEAITGVKLVSIISQNDPRLPLYFVFVPFTLLYVWACFTLLAKRLHDMGQSSWWSLPMVPLLGGVSFTSLAKRLSDMDQPGWWSLLLIIPVVGGLLWLVLLVAPGDAFDNKYGPAPKQAI